MVKKTFFSLLTLVLFTSISPLYAKFSPKQISWEALGDVKIGMTVKEAEKVLGQKLVSDSTGKPNAECYIASPKQSVNGVYFIITHWKIAASGLAYDAPASIVTPANLKIGTAQNQVLKFYPKAKVEEHPYYEGGKIFTLYSSDQKNGMIIGADGKKVIYIQAGQVPEVFNEEGCE